MAESILDILFRTKKTGDGEKQTHSGLQDLAGAFEGLTGVSLTAAGALTAGAAAMKFVIDAASDAQQAQAQLNAVLDSTRGAAGLSADEINRMATQLSDLTAVEDDTIVKASSVMLTFTKIGEDVFPDATLAALNMSQALGQDLQSSVIQVGKALNDPIEGVTALKRVGVSFTESQMDMIRALVESGQTMEAQRLILAELNTEFGGAAEAFAGTYAGQVATLKNEFGNMAETIGGALVPVLTTAVGTLNTLLTANRKVTDALAEHEAEVRVNADSYTAYIEEMERSLNATGRALEVDEEGIRVLEVRGNGLADVTDKFSVLTQAEWENVQAVEGWNSAEREAAVAAQAAGAATAAAGEAAGEAEPKVEDLAGAYDEAGDAAAAAAKHADEIAKANKNLAEAQDKLKSAQKAWKDDVGNDIAGLLKDAKLSTEDYEGALGVLDDQFGTNLLSEEKLRLEQQKLVDEFKRTGDLDAFRQGIKDLADTFEPLDAKIREAQGAVDALIDRLAVLDGTTITIDVSVNGGGEDDDGSDDACFAAGTMVTTPEGLRAIETIKAGDLVTVLTAAGPVNAPVLLTRRATRDGIVTVTTSDGQRITCSCNHPWATPGGWLWASFLRPGQELVTDHGAVQVVGKQMEAGRWQVFNFMVEHPEHTYLVGGIQVHNDVDMKSAGRPSGGSSYSGGAPLVNTVIINNGVEYEQFLFDLASRLGG